MGIRRISRELLMFDYIVSIATLFRWPALVQVLARNGEKVKSIPNSYWKFQPEADSFIFGLFAECIADIAESKRRFDELLAKKQLTTYSIDKAARDISVAIRKVMLDDGGHIFKTCVEPRLHPLRSPQKALIEPDVHVEKIEGMTLTYTVGQSGPERTAAAPPYKHETVVYPLYGLRKTAKERYRLNDPFDLSRQPIKYGKWLNIKVLQVGNTLFTAERILHLVATKGGAHVELNEMTRHSPSLPVEVKLPKDKDELYRKGNWVTFSGTSYLHIFTFLTGIYLVNMMKTTLKHIPDNLKTDQKISYLSNTILKASSQLRSPTFLLEKQFNTGIVFHSTGNPNNPIEPVGDYDKVGVTTIQIPGW